MVMLPQVFNVADVPEDEFEPVPAGTYDAVITESEYKTTANGNGAYIQLKIELENGRTLFERLNIQNANETAVKIAYQTLAKICKAVGKPSITDSTALHNIPFKVEIVVEPAKPYTDKTGVQRAGSPQNAIKKYLPKFSDNGAGASSMPASGNAAPASAAPQAQQANSLPPWMAK